MTIAPTRATGAPPIADTPGALAPHEAALFTRNVCLDTSAYVTARFAFDGPAFTRLAELAKAGKVRVFITPVVRREVESNIAELAQRGQAAVLEMQKKAAMLSEVGIPDVRALVHTKYDRDAVIRNYHERFDEFLRAARVEEIPLASADVEAIFDAYFGKRAPFGTGKKKAEFPDAFTVSALDGWCQANAEQMYVVTGDGAKREGVSPEELEDERSMTSACTDAGPLLPLGRLAQFLDLVNREEYRAAAQQVRADVAYRWTGFHQAQLRTEVTDRFLELGYQPDDPEADVEDVDVREVVVRDPDVISVNDERAIVSALAEVNFTARVSVIDPDSGIWDSEDKVMLFQEHQSVFVRHATTMPVEFEIAFPELKAGALPPTAEMLLAESGLESVTVNDDRPIIVPLDEDRWYLVDPDQLDAFDRR